MEMHEEHEGRINWPFDISANFSPPDDPGCRRHDSPRSVHVA